VQILVFKLCAFATNNNGADTFSSPFHNLWIRHWIEHVVCGWTACSAEWSIEQLCLIVSVDRVLVLSDIKH